MANKQKISTIVVNNVMAFIKPFASKTLQKAISVLLQPCCTNSITDVSNDCSTSTVTLTLATPIPSWAALGAFAQVFSVTNGFIGAGTLSADGNTISVSTLTTPTGIDQIFSVTIFLPSTQTNSTIGVYQIAVGVGTIEVCP